MVLLMKKKMVSSLSVKSTNVKLNMKTDTEMTTAQKLVQLSAHVQTHAQKNGIVTEFTKLPLKSSNNMITMVTD